jgi:hypothetical protein
MIFRSSTTGIHKLAACIQTRWLASNAISHPDDADTDAPCIVGHLNKLTQSIAGDFIDSMHLLTESKFYVSSKWFPYHCVQNVATVLTKSRGLLAIRSHPLYVLMAVTPKVAKTDATKCIKGKGNADMGLGEFGITGVHFKLN